MYPTARPLFGVALLLGTLPSCVPDKDGDSDDSGTLPLTVVPVSADITAATTWTPDNLYRVDTSIVVTAPLTVEAGTIVKLGDALAITVDTGGAILAGGGDADHPCVFTSFADDAHGGDTNEDADATSPAPGDWGYVLVRESGSVFDRCLFLYGGANMPYTGTLLVHDDAAITVTRSTFAYDQGGTPEDTRAAAFDAAGAGPGTVITGNTFYATDLPLRVAGAYDVDDSNTFHADVDGVPTGNTYDGIFWAGSYEITGDVAWTNTEVPYIVSGNPLGIPEGGSLTLGEGVTLKFDADQRIDVSGALLATDVVFTSLLDDAVIGDTNGDGAATTPGPGVWGSVKISGDGTTLQGCRFSYGGSAAPYTGVVSVSAGAEPTISGNIFAYNAGGTLTDSRAAALNVVSAGGGVVVTGNTFHDNDLPLVVSGDTTLDDTNAFSDGDAHNVLDAILVDGDVNAATTWAETEVAFVLSGTVLGIDAQGTLTLGDGVVVKSDGGRIDVHGALEQGAGVWFTSLYDDALVGDTTGDGADTVPEDGDWSGVNLCLGGPCQWADWGNILYARYPE